MADISASAVMALRNKLGISMMECKNALVEANGDEEKAAEILKKKGIAKAEKKADRETHEGAIMISGAAYVKVLCETDFVARNENFIAFVKEIADKASSEGSENAKSYFESVKAEKMTQMGENLVLDAVEKLEGEIVGGYVHSNNKIASLVVLNGGTKELAKDIAMHIVGMKPSVISYQDLDKVTVEKETEGRIAAIKEENIERGRLQKPLLNIPKFISRTQITDEVLEEITVKMKEDLKAEGKPEQIWDKILPGKLERFIDDNTSYDRENALLSQDFVKDPSKKVQKLLSEANASVVKFLRVEV